MLQFKCVSNNTNACTRGLCTENNGLLHGLNSEENISYSNITCAQTALARPLHLVSEMQ